MIEIDESSLVSVLALLLAKVLQKEKMIILAAFRILLLLHYSVHI